MAETVVVTATASAEDEPAIGAATTVITRERIERGGFRTVAEVLRSVPGVDIVRSGSDGAATFSPSTAESTEIAGVIMLSP